MHPFNHGVGRHNQPLVPASGHNRRIVAGAHENRGRQTRKARQYPFQESTFMELVEFHAGSRLVSRFAVWGGSLNLHQQVEPL
jgi:hypothetical protein